MLSPLDKLDEPASLVALREKVGRLLPRVDLPELIVEVAARTGFTDAFTHLSERTTRAVRQTALDEHYTRYPQRYVNGRPTVALPPSAVHINPDLAMNAQQLIDTPASMQCEPTPINAMLPEVVT